MVPCTPRSRICGPARATSCSTASWRSVPHIGVTVPVADYETIGNTVGGRHLKAAHLGLSIGKTFIDALYVHLSYEFSLVETYDRVADTAKYGQNRSDVALSVGYQFMEGKLDVSLATNARITHDGVSFNDFASSHAG